MIIFCFDFFIGQAIINYEKSVRKSVTTTSHNIWSSIAEGGSKSGSLVVELYPAGFGMKHLIYDNEYSGFGYYLLYDEKELLSNIISTF